MRGLIKRVSRSSLGLRIWTADRLKHKKKSRSPAPEIGFLEGSGMASKSSTVKIGPAIDAALYKEFVQVAKQHGQSQRYLLEKAIEHYIRNVVPSRQMVRPEVMEAYQRSNEKFGNSTRSWPNRWPSAFTLRSRKFWAFIVNKSRSTAATQG